MPVAINATAAAPGIVQAGKRMIYSIHPLFAQSAIFTGKSAVKNAHTLNSSAREMRRIGLNRWVKCSDSILESSHKGMNTKSKFCAKGTGNISMKTSRKLGILCETFGSRTLTNTQRKMVTCTMHRNMSMAITSQRFQSIPSTSLRTCYGRFSPPKMTSIGIASLPRPSRLMHMLGQRKKAPTVQIPERKLGSIPQNSVFPPFFSTRLCSDIFPRLFSTNHSNIVSYGWQSKSPIKSSSSNIRNYRGGCQNILKSRQLDLRCFSITSNKEKEDSTPESPSDSSQATLSKNRKHPSTSSKPSIIEPKLQDTEVPLWSFFSKSSFVDSSNRPRLPHLTQIDLDQLYGTSSSHNSKDANDKNVGSADGMKLQPPPITKVLSILVPETKSLLLALGALTVSTAATMQFPNAIGQMIDILSGVPVDVGLGIFDAGLDATDVSIGADASNETGGGSVLAGGMDTASASAQTPQQLEQMQTIALQMMGFFTLGAVATFSHSAMFDSIGQKIGARLRKQLFTTILHQDVAFFDKNRAGELANRLSTDVHEVAEHLVQNIAVFLSNVVRSITAIISMIAISPTLTIYLSPVVPLLGGCAAVYGKFIKHWSKQHLDVLAHSTHVATERFSGIATVLSFGQRSKEVARYSSVIEAAYGFARRVALFQGAFLGSSYFVGNAALLGVLWVGAGQVFGGTMSAGQLAGFCMYAGHLADGVLEISESLGGFLRAQGSGARLFSLLDRGEASQSKDVGADGTTKNSIGSVSLKTKLDQNDPTSLITTDGQPLQTALPPTYKPTIRFQGVQFAYPSHPNVPILREVSFSVSNGEMLAVTGSSGSGKSSIVNLLLRLYEPSGGRITLDGVDIRDLSVDWLRSQIGTVRQEPILFHASVFENVAYGKPNATHDEVIEACIAANAHHFILDLPNGYDTIVGERGASVSGGQKQRLSIARALLTKPRILALDEASSALDAPAEHDFLRRLRHLLNSDDNNLSVVLFITHKKSVLKACDRVAVLSEGMVTEKGTYDFLEMTKGDQLRKLMMQESSSSSIK